MSWRFRKRVRVVKGIWVNVAKTGASLSVGRPGLTGNFNHKGSMGTFSVPGSGLSYRTRRYPYMTRWSSGAPGQRGQQRQQQHRQGNSASQSISNGLAWAVWVTLMFCALAYALYFATGGL